jgi:hypothetical protein
MPRPRPAKPVDSLHIHGAEARAAAADRKTFIRNHADGIASIDLFVVQRSQSSTHAAELTILPMFI